MMTMHDYVAATYGDVIADDYDRLFAEGLGDAEMAATFLAKRSSGGRALELGIGTGRLALPLAGRGVAVWGIDASEQIVQQLHGKPGGAEIPLVIGDMADLAVEGLFSLIYIAFNTFYLLPRQEEQARCFRNVADHLEAGGAFVIEAMVPDETMYDRGQRVHVHRVDAESVWLEAARYDPVTRELRSQQVILTELGTRLYPARLRFAPPPELDLMAAMAGLQLAERWGGWELEPFTQDSGSHVSVYRKTSV